MGRISWHSNEQSLNSFGKLKFREFNIARTVPTMNVEYSPKRFPFVSVIVSFHNEGAVLNQCVGSLLKQSYPSENYEIVLVNDGSNDRSVEDAAELVRAHPERIKILSQTDKGPAAGRNLGVTNSRGSIVAFTDPDCTADSDWLLKHVENYASEDVDGVEGRVETDWDELMQPIRISPAGYRYVTCNISYRRDVLQEVGLFDENFRWKEDDDLAYRVIEAGWSIVSDNSAVIFHPVKKLSAGGLISFGLKHRYDVLFYQKHPKVAGNYFHTVEVGPLVLTREFLLICGGAMILLTVVAGLWTGNPIWLLALVAAGLWAEFRRRRMLRRRVKASILWMSVFVIFIEIGRLWGTLKFRKFFL